MEIFLLLPKTTYCSFTCWCLPVIWNWNLFHSAWFGFLQANTCRYNDVDLCSLTPSPTPSTLLCHQFHHHEAGQMSIHEIIYEQYNSSVVEALWMKPGQNFGHDSERWGQGRSVFGQFSSEKRGMPVTMNSRVPSLLPRASHVALLFSWRSLSHESSLERNIIDPWHVTFMSHWMKGKIIMCTIDDIPI